MVVTWLWDASSPHQLGELFSQGRYFHVDPAHLTSWGSCSREAGISMWGYIDEI